MGNFGAEFLCIAANTIGSPVYHIFNLCIEKGIVPQNWKIAKAIQLPKNRAAPFSGANCQPISLLPALGKVMERLCLNKLNIILISII